MCKCYTHYIWNNPPIPAGDRIDSCPRTAQSVQSGDPRLPETFNSARKWQGIYRDTSTGTAAHMTAGLIHHDELQAFVEQTLQNRFKVYSWRPIYELMWYCEEFFCWMVLVLRSILVFIDFNQRTFGWNCVYLDHTIFRTQRRPKTQLEAITTRLVTTLEFTQFESSCLSNTSVLIRTPHFTFISSIHLKRYNGRQSHGNSEYWAHVVFELWQFEEMKLKFTCKNN